MRLTEYIEKQRGRNITEEECQKLLDTTHKISYDSKAEIFRGVYDYGDYVYIDPSKVKEHRVSANTFNYYTLIIDNTPAWKAYPKRSKSIICTTDYDYADSFGSIYSVFPANGATIGVCNGTDIWPSVHYKDYNFEGIGGYIAKIIRTDTINVSSADYDYQNMVKIFKLVDKKKDEIYDEMLERSNTYAKYYTIFFEDYLKSGKSFLGFIEYLLDPVKCGFSLTKAGTVIPDGREVWISAPCVLVKYDN